VLSRSEHVTLSIAYLDSYPEGFELRIEARTDIAFDDLSRPGDSGPDVFGRHWPMVGERRDALPAQLLRVGVQFADGRRATSINDRPAGGPIMWPLTGGGRGTATGSQFEQGYWISPMPPPGPVIVACEWPATGVSLVTYEIDAGAILDGAERAKALFPDGNEVLKDGRQWRLGGDAEVAWINDGTPANAAIAAAVPRVFASYCTLQLPPNRDRSRPGYERSVIEFLAEQTEPQPWWLGYLGGVDEVVFPYAPRTTIYGHEYVLVQAGPQEAARWRDSVFKGALPDLMFPEDHSWLLSTRWGDDWTSVGGSEQLISSMLTQPKLGRLLTRVTPGAEPGPPAEEPT
jgi:hypothetical protein